MVSMSSGEDFGLIKWPEQKKKNKKKNKTEF